MIGDGVCANFLVDFVSNLQKKTREKTDKTSHGKISSKLFPFRPGGIQGLNLTSKNGLFFWRLFQQMPRWKWSLQEDEGLLPTTWKISYCSFSTLPLNP